MILPALSGRLPIWMAAAIAAPDEIPPGNAFVPRQRARGVDCRRAVDLDDLVDDRAIQNVRHEARTDALNLVRRMLAAGQDGAFLRLDGNDLDRGLVLFQHLADAGDGAAGADAGDEVSR